MKIKIKPTFETNTLLVKSSVLYTVSIKDYTEYLFNLNNIKKICEVSGYELLIDTHDLKEIEYLFGILQKENRRKRN